jgi:hypothetical protein
MWAYIFLLQKPRGETQCAQIGKHAMGEKHLKHVKDAGPQRIPPRWERKKGNGNCNFTLFLESFELRTGGGGRPSDKTLSERTGGK